VKIVDVDDALLARWPLPMPGLDDDKERRGHALVVAGGRELPGAPLLAGEAALRAGCGKVLVATAACVATPVGVALPEARVLALPEDERGGLDAEGVSVVAPWSDRVASVLVGPGLFGSTEFVRRLLTGFAGCPMVLDAAAMDVVRDGLAGDVLMTPHAGEMAHLTGAQKPEVQADPAEAAAHAAARWNVTVVLKGAQTFVATPRGEVWRHDGRGLVGLAMSGSGDVLAGVIAGLVARGAPLAQAAVWGVVLHARAGEALARRVGPLGYLARELPGEVARALS